MWAEHSGNFIEACKPPWKENLDWNLHMRNGEIQTPFHHYISPPPGRHSSPYQSSHFEFFEKLPIELQFRVLGFCSPQTLFQFMQVSRTLRPEASKLFWGNQNNFYIIEGYWLLKGGYPGHTGYDLSFMTHVQNLEIELNRRLDDKISRVEGCETEGLLKVLALKTRRDITETFWGGIKRGFPRVKTVVFNHNWISWATGEAKETMSEVVQLLVKSSPPGIEVFVSMLERYDRMRAYASRQLRYRKSFRRLGPDGGITRTSVPSDHTSILMPLKDFEGPVGEYMRIKYIYNRIDLQRAAIMALSVQLLDRHHFDNGRNEDFSCPWESECDALFEKAGQWTIHAVRRHQEDLMADIEYDYLPSELREIVQAHEKSIEDKEEELFEAWTKVHDDWHNGEFEGYVSLTAQKSWLDQLNNDEAWETESRGKESILWRRFYEDMSTSDPSCFHDKPICFFDDITDD